MRILIALFLLFSILACKKNSDDDKLPKPLQELVGSIRNCDCKPVLNKYEYTDSTWTKQAIYIFSSDICRFAPVYYDRNGHVTTLPANHNLQFVERVWRCKPW
jgi:hypothetical protein